MLTSAKMMCRECKHATIGSAKSDKQMAVFGYRSCELARNEIERAKYVHVAQKCLWQGRVGKT